MTKYISVVIPIYKEVPSFNEQKAFERCLSILFKHSITIICPHNIDLKFYEEISLRYNIKLIFENFKAEYFISIKGYNELLLSLNFYRKFQQYDYILIYQLDAWVFQDDLLEWTALDYDNIGAPWIKISSKKIEKYSGNGGFCLRKIQPCIETLQSQKRLFSPYLLWYIFKGLPINYIWRYKYLFKLLFPIFPKASVFITSFINNNMNEDKFWAKFAPYINKKFNPYPGKKAMSFAFDKHPEVLFNMNNNHLPFGAHGWYKKDRNNFWKNYIKH